MNPLSVDLANTSSADLVNGQEQISYLNALRSIRAKHGNRHKSFMATHRMLDRDLKQRVDNIWIKLFRLSSWPGIHFLLKVLACMERMTTIESAFVIQRMEFNRQRLWREYASIRYGASRDNPNDDPLENYYTLLTEYSDRIPPPEMKSQHMRPLRIRWLA